MHIGNKHDYLEVDLEFEQDGRLKVSMVNYLKNVIKAFPEQIVGRATTPAGERLFDIRDEKEARPLGRGTCNSLSSHHCAVVIYGSASAMRHSDGGSLPDYKSQVTTQGRLGEAKKIIEVLEWHKISEAEH
jgi:hypothetical protein